MDLEERIRRYCDYVKQTRYRDPDCFFLWNFFESPIDGERQGYVRVYYRNVDTNSLGSQAFGVDAPLEPILASDNVKAVIIFHSETWVLDRKLMQVVASAFDIDPSRLQHHLDYPGCLERLVDVGITIGTLKCYEDELSELELPSEMSRRALEIRNDAARMSACLHRDAALIFLRSDWPFIRCHLNALNNSIFTDTEDWVQFLRPFVRSLLARYYLDFRQNVQNRSPPILLQDSSKRDFGYMLKLQQELHEFRTRLSNFIQIDTENSESILRLGMLLHDVNQLELQLKRAIKTYSR